MFHRHGFNTRRIQISVVTPMGFALIGTAVYSNVGIYSFEAHITSISRHFYKMRGPVSDIMAQPLFFKKPSTTAHI